MGEQHRLTWLAIIVAILMTIPGLVLGGIAAWIYKAFMLPYLEGNLLNWITAGWFEKLTVAVFPNVVQGMAAGAFGIYITSKILKFANYEIVAYSTATIVVALTLFGLSLAFAKSGLD